MLAENLRFGLPRSRTTLLGMAKAVLVAGMLAACAQPGQLKEQPKGRLNVTGEALNRDELLILVKSNQIVFVRRGGQLRRICRCGPKVYTHEIARHLKNAVVAIEDERFFLHRGWDPIGVSRALYRWFGHPLRPPEGGSTITQQLIKNAILTSRREWDRKRTEFALAVEIERLLNKDQILVAYLNQAIFAEGMHGPIVGVEQAARYFFGRSASELSLYQSALLAGLLRAPSHLNPDRHPKRARDRAKVVLQKMLEQDSISRKEFGAALKDDRPRGSRHPIEFDTRHFTNWVMTEIRALYPDLVFDEYTRIPITLEALSEARAEHALDAALSKRNLRFAEAGLVTMSHDGRVVLMVGSRNYSANQFNVVTQARRQPASTFKAFVFLAALEQGVVRPSPDIEAALARSDNGYSKRFTRLVTPNAVVKVAKRLGISSPLRADESIALGTSEVTLLELTRAYASFASAGYAATPYGYYGITRNGSVLEWRASQRGPRVVGADLVRAMRKMLRRVVLSGTGRPAAAVARASGKTGTSDANRDAWFIGYTPRHVTGLWVGNLDNSPMPGVSGTTAASVWAYVVKALPDE